MKEGGRRFRVRERREDENRGQSDEIVGTDDGRSREPRNAGTLWKLDKARKWVLP